MPPISDIHYQQRPLIFEPGAPFVKDSETSKEAAKSITRKKLSKMCLLVRTVISNSVNGMTCEEVELATGLKHQTASARLKDLRDGKYITWKTNPKTGKHITRANTSGRSGKVYFFNHNTDT